MTSLANNADDLLTQRHGTQTDVGNCEFSHKNKAICGKTFMNSHKINGESTRNILLNEAVYLHVCAIRTGH